MFKLVNRPTFCYFPLNYTQQTQIQGELRGYILYIYRLGFYNQITKLSLPRARYVWCFSELVRRQRAASFNNIPQSVASDRLLLLLLKPLHCTVSASCLATICTKYFTEDGQNANLYMGQLWKHGAYLICIITGKHWIVWRVNVVLLQAIFVLWTWNNIIADG